MCIGSKQTCEAQQDLLDDENDDETDDENHDKTDDENDVAVDDADKENQQVQKKRKISMVRTYVGHNYVYNC